MTEKEKLNILQTENEELKKEVRKYRYAPPPSTTTVADEPRAEQNPSSVYEDDSLLPLQGDFAQVMEGNNDEDLLDEREFNFTSFAFEPMDKHSFTPIEEDVEEVLEEEEEILDENDETEEEPSIADDLDQIFTLFKGTMRKTSKKIFGSTNFKPERAYEVIENIKKEAKKAYENFPQNEEELSEMFVKIDEVMFSKVAELQDLIMSQSGKHHLEATKNVVNKLGKSFVTTLDKVSHVVKRKEKWLNDSWVTLKDDFNSKWLKIVDKYERVIRKEDASEFMSSRNKFEEEKDRTIVETEKEAEIKEAADAAEKDDIKPLMMSNYTQWMEDQSKMERNATASWLFKRYQERDTARREGGRSDWMFDRASDRKKRHELKFSTSWGLMKANRRRCVEGPDGEMICHDLNNVRANDQQTKIKKQTMRNRIGRVRVRVSKFSINLPKEMHTSNPKPNKPFNY